MDRHRFREPFEAYITALNEHGFPILFFGVWDGSKHHAVSRNIALYSASEVDRRDSRRKATFRQLTASACGGGSANDKASRTYEVLCDELPLRVIAQLGGGTTDNASDAISETKAVFKKVMDDVKADPALQSLRMAFGVERWVIIMGDPYHIDNLAVKWASLIAFGQTIRGDHRQTHHRQLLQSIHDMRKIDPVVAQNAMDKVMGGKDLLRLRTTRERMERWLVNQRQAAWVLSAMQRKDESEGAA